MVTVNKILEIARSSVSDVCYEGSVAHKRILNVYNSNKPLARNYKVKVKDHWCMTFISYLFIMVDATKLIGGTECSCGRAIEKAKKAGIWIEDGNVAPKPGDIIFYDWDAKDGWPEHVGIVESVNGVSITVIEGNYKNRVGRRVINRGWKYIRGYARPNYSNTLDNIQFNSPKKPLRKIAEEVIRGAWGVGALRIGALKRAGYDPEEVQRMVNEIINEPKSGTTTIQVAEEVVNGEWGNGRDREKRLKEFGYDPAYIQRIVNCILGTNK